VVIDRAITRQRLGHSLLLHGDDLDTLGAVAHAIADRLLNPPEAPAARRRDIAGGAHPDCFVLRPTGKLRQILADPTRELISRVQMTASVGRRKVAIVYEADRMNPTAANIFLKTLEEPPAHTTLLLLTTHPYALLPTIRSRCLHFKFAPARAGANSSAAAPATDISPLTAWLDDYRAWLARLPDSATDKRTVAEHVFTVYGLVARFASIVESTTAEAWARQKETLPPDLDEDQQIAIETGLASGMRARFLARIEESTSAHARERLRDGDLSARRSFTGAVERLEHGARLLRLNLNESAALEDFLLASLRLWSRR
jgi:DNA polymerase-3 subunit delta'